MVQCNFQNNYDVIAHKKVCRYAPIFNFLLWTPEFSLNIPKAKYTNTELINMLDSNIESLLQLHDHSLTHCCA